MCVLGLKSFFFNATLLISANTNLKNETKTHLLIFIFLYFLEGNLLVVFANSHKYSCFFCHKLFFHKKKHGLQAQL